MADYDVKNDCYVTVCPMPPHIRGLVKKIVDVQVILINETLSDEAKKKTLQHELRHLQRNDLHRAAPIEEIEEDDR